MRSIRRVFSPFLSCPAGASPLGKMPSAGELGLAAANAGEDPLASTSASETCSAPGLSDSMASGAPLSGKPSASSSGGVSDHGFPLISVKVVNKIQNWEFINTCMSELLPNNLELARRSVELRGVSSCATLKLP